MKTKATEVLWSVRWRDGGKLKQKEFPDDEIGARHWYQKCRSLMMPAELAKTTAMTPFQWLCTGKMHWLGMKIPLVHTFGALVIAVATWLAFLQ